jgi:hypothetical protein
VEDDAETESGIGDKKKELYKSRTLTNNKLTNSSKDEDENN